MHPFDVFLMISMSAGAFLWIWALRDLGRAFSIHRALVRSLASDDEFLQHAPFVWDCQTNSAEFTRVRTIISDHIGRLRWAKELPWPLSQSPWMKLRDVQALVGAVEKCLQRQTQ